MRIWIAAIACVAGCYAGPRATRDINAAWQGRTRAEIERRWGAPGAVEAQDDGSTALIWSYTRHHVELPSGSFRLSLDPEQLELDAEVRPGAVWSTQTHAAALVDARSVIAGVTGASLRWGPPNDANIRWGTVLGLHVGMGRLDDTSTPLPSGGLYIGGMLSRTLALVGTFSLVSGSDDDGGAMGFSWGLAAQWWADARASLRAGPALVLALDPGFEDPSLEPGINGGVSYAVIKVGTFALDLRFDLTAAPSSTFGSLGVGVNLN